jgi:alginate O-acetyltransferase complex protein AlgI
MVFSSLVFVCGFLPFVAGIYFFSPPQLRNLVLVIASVVFYAWSSTLAVLLVMLLVGLNFRLGRMIEVRSGWERRIIFIGALSVNLTVLIVLKYTGFLLHNVNVVLAMFSQHRVPVWYFPLPLGISFFTFHIISYLVDVHRGSVKSQPSPTAFTLYIINFPQLIAGPIIRYRQIADQLPIRAVVFADIDAGVGRFTVGMVKKLLVADPIGSIVDQVFAVSPDQLTTGSAWLGAVCYGLQIYFDFSGYSDMAIGLGRIFGFRFPENFNYPYFATSMRDFWQRWHMTLSAWFRDYVYIPLGGNQRGPWVTARNLWIVFFLCGAWHGASWNFIVWGLWQGLFLSIERLRPLEAMFARLPQLFRHFYLIIVVLFGWVFFRSPDLEFALGYLARMLGFAASHEGLPLILNVSAPMKTLIAAACCISLPLWPRLRTTVEQLNVSNSGAAAIEFARAAVVTSAMILSLGVMAGEQYSPFIYFRF